MDIKAREDFKIWVGVILGVFLLVVLWGILVPYSLQPLPESNYMVTKGFGYKEIGRDLEQKKIIRSAIFFNLYVLISGNHNNLQAGNYEISPSMSVVKIAQKIANGQVARNNIIIIEGFSVKDIGNYLESKNIGSNKDFLAIVKKDFSSQYSFLKDKPKKLNLEGYLFPDTYDVGKAPTQEALVINMLSNFDRKLTLDLKKEIARQKKSIFEIITMASILEKEVKSINDKKIVAGILWKRIDSNMGLNVDSTINYITGKSDASVLIKDTQINSPYNTYKYRGLPLGPICNPGMDSILAAIYPTQSDWWYYLSATKTGETIFSKTLEEHNASALKYL